MWEYSDKVREHYLNPRNVGEVENPDGVGEVGNIKCGDALRLTFKLDGNGRIADIKFKTFGCGSAIAASSMLTELCKGKTLEEASQISNKDIADALGGLPAAKMHCSVMGQEGLEAAIKYYRSGGQITSEEGHEGTVICTCFNVTDIEIERAIRENNLTAIDDVTNFTKAGGGCGGCKPQIKEILNRINGPSVESAAEAVAEPRMTTLEKIDKIRAVLDQEIRPILQKDGGDCELVDVDGNTVHIRFTGMCAGCAFAGMTQVSVVEDTLKKKVLPGLTVKQAP
ncbi:MAG: Fe-S cluster assembly protein NifU [Chitinivibrionales bacterium]|nr:Fe-S cluster assembly protein NifU [Chitinivibrionales bacterium]MBD3396178.1 Fe-S cluster assembly protein NifU [Chitinivibrionales bacterium]